MTRLLPDLFAVTEPSRLTSGRIVSTALVASIARRRMTSVTNWLRAAPLLPTRPGCDAAVSIGWMRIRAVRRRHRDQPVGAQRRQEDLEIFGAAERTVSNDRHFARDAVVDDESATGDARRILDERADVGIAQVEYLLCDDRLRSDAAQQQGKSEALHEPTFADNVTV